MFLDVLYFRKITLTAQMMMFFNDMPIKSINLTGCGPINDSILGK